MTYKEFCKYGFSSGMGFKLYHDDCKYELSETDFETGDCDTARGDTYPIDEIESFFYFDGTPIQKRP